MKTLDWLLRLGLAGVFIGAALTKIADPAAFHAAILTYRTLPEAMVPALALWLPWVELCTGIALLWPRHRRAALWLVAAMTLVFLAAIGQAAWRGLDIVCGCFGRPAAVRGTGYAKYLVRDLALLAVAVWLLRRERPSRPAAGKP
jgi:uncharacterized membrane protein YphA (DoxX/SURF4 family)